MKHAPISMMLLGCVAVVGCFAGTAGPSAGKTGGQGGSGAGGAGGQVIPTSDGPDQDPDYPPLPDGPPTRAPTDLVAPPDNPPAVIMVDNSACKALQMGPFAPVMPLANFSEKAPPIKSDGQAYRIALPSHAQAFVTFTAPTEGTYVVFTSVALPVGFFSLSGDIFSEKNFVMSVGECTQVKARYTYAMPAGSFVFRFGPDPKNAATVDVVVVKQL
jgi:hypothetical protein